MVWQTFIRPSHRQAEAHSDRERTSYKYQFSVLPALHSADVAGESCLLIRTLTTWWQKPMTFNSSITSRFFTGYFRSPGGQIGPDFTLAFQTMWGNLITTDKSSIDSLIAIGAVAASNASSTISANPASSWPPFNTIYAPNQLNLNQTGGTAFQSPQSPMQNVTEYGEPGLSHVIGFFNAYTWEGGRGYRCDFWRSVGNLVPSEQAPSGGECNERRM